MYCMLMCVCKYACIQDFVQLTMWLYYNYIEIIIINNYYYILSVKCQENTFFSFYIVNQFIEINLSNCDFIYWYRDTFDEWNKKMKFMDYYIIYKYWIFFVEINMWYIDMYFVYAYVCMYKSKLEIGCYYKKKFVI